MGDNCLIIKGSNSKARGQGVGGNRSSVVNKVTSPLAENSNKRGTCNASPPEQNANKRTSAMVEDANEKASSFMVGMPFMTLSYEEYMGEVECDLFRNEVCIGSCRWEKGVKSCTYAKGKESEVLKKTGLYKNDA